MGAPQALSLNLSLSFPPFLYSKWVNRWLRNGKWEGEKKNTEEARVECFLPGIRVAGSSSPPWERVRTGAAPVQMLRKARHVPKAQAWIRLRGRDRGGGLSRSEIAFQVPVPDKDPGHRRDCSSPLRLAGVEGWVGGGREVVCRERTLGDRGGEFPVSGPRGELQAGGGE